MSIRRALPLLLLPALLLTGCSDSGYVPKPGAARSVRMLVIPPQDGPLGNKNCRHAVFSAIDRVALGGSPAYTITTPSRDWFDGNYQPFANNDIEAARTELAKCGYPNGFPVSISSFHGMKELAPSLERVGITLSEDAPSKIYEFDYRKPTGDSVEFWTPLMSYAPDAAKLLVDSGLMNDTTLSGNANRMVDRLMLDEGHYIPLTYIDR